MFRLSGEVQAQEKFAASLNHITSIDSTDMVVASQSDGGKGILSFPGVNKLLFLNTRTQETRIVELPAGFVISRTFLNVPGRYEGERLVLISGTYKGWGNNEKLEWNDPEYLFVSTASGQHLKQISPEEERLVEWTVNKNSNTLALITRPDTNKDKKYDAKDSNKLYIYHLTSGQLIAMPPL
ncbi:hypothetical protein DC20_06710 [Rufibacter tibetensis]|uniref:Uncharacterized protein n=2 Tax=Rufibacter tibetensis TaxID=512763 RepID=A0A0P0CTZ4_9BACT|nr:hypothetical protein DC20_06710 [Rufibacter tibetensis]